jgi:hypothetical protein
VTRTESSCSSSQHRILPYVAFNKTRSPTAGGHRQPDKSFSLPKQAQVFSREFQAQYQAFVRFAVTSSAALSAIALKWDLAFGTFHSGRALALRTLAFTRSIYGASNPGPMLWGGT